MIEYVTMQDAAGATGDGVAVLTHGMNAFIAQVSGTLTNLEVTFEHTVDGTNYVALIGINKATGAKASTATAAGVFIFNTSGSVSVRARVSTFVAGSVTVVGAAMQDTSIGIQIVGS